MRTSNQNDANGISKLALLASAAAAAALVVSQTRVLERQYDGPSARRRRPPAMTEARHPAVMALLATTSDAPSGSGDEEFDAEYLAIVDAITHDGQVDDYDFDADYLTIVESIVRDGPLEEEPDTPEVQPLTGPALRSRLGITVEEMWWLPTPRLQYIFAALIYIAASVAVGSDPVSLALEGVLALTAIDSTNDFVLLGWLFCGLIILVPLSAIVSRPLRLATGGRLNLPGPLSQDSIDFADWGVRFLATSAFIAGAVLYTPHALGWALNTDYPVAAVSSSSMSPGLDEDDLVLIDGVANIDQLQVGDIIAFRHGQGIAVRRITGFTEGAAIARADASPRQDIVVPFEDIAGRVLTVAGAQVKLPLLGSISLLGERTVEPFEAVRALP